MPTLHDVVILGGARTPQGKLLGQLASLSAVQLGAHAVSAALERTGVAKNAVEHVYMGQVLQAGCGQNPAKQTAMAAGLPAHVPAVTVNKVCLSGLVSIIDAARMIRLGEASVVVAGGQESMSQAPHVTAVRVGHPYGNLDLVDTMAGDGLSDASEGISMGNLTERGNSNLSITRLQQDEIAAASHQRAAAAQEAGLFEQEIAPLTIPQRKGEPLVISADQGVRGDSTTETLSRLRPAFSEEGTITAGNSSPISDGAAALVLASKDYAEAHGLTWLAEIGAAGQTAGPDNQLHHQPSRATAAALQKAGWQASDLDFWEINEAFAAIALASSDELGVGAQKVNIHGGAIALGHPIGASGARITLHAALELARRGNGKAAVSLCGGGGQGEALLLFR